MERLRVRPLEPGETDVVQHVFDGMSVWSRYLRYHTAMPRLSAANLAALTAVDGSRRVALVAERLGPGGAVPAGLAHLVGVAPDRAEVAVEVVDELHRRGVGTALVQHVVTAARRLGYRRLEATVLTTNTAMLGLLAGAFPAAEATYEGPAVSLEIPLGPSPAAGWAGPVWWR